MPYEKMARLVARLAARTEDGSVNWEETAVTGQFQLAFPNYSVLVLLQESKGQIAGALDVVLRVCNTAGDVVEEVADPDLEDILENPYQDMLELYQLARRSAMGVEDALNSILSALEDEDDDKVPF